MNIKEDFIPEGLPCDTKQWFKNGEYTGITIHWIGPYPGQSPADVRKWWIDSKGQASAHVVIKENDVLICWPLNKCAWHAGDRVGNSTNIGIEVIPKNKEGEFSEKTIETLKEFLATLKPVKLMRHYDWTRKDCPRFYCNDAKWEELKKKIRPSSV